MGARAGPGEDLLGHQDQVDALDALPQERAQACDHDPANGNPKKGRQGIFPPTPLPRLEGGHHGLFDSVGD